MSVELGPFRLFEPVARGGMAEVWRGAHLATGVPVAVKVMTGRLAQQARYRGQFRNEVRAMARLTHPGVIHVFDHGEIEARHEAADPRLAAGSPYLVMEFAGAGSLYHQKEPFGWEAMRSVLAALLDALAHAHSRGVIHRDVKPGNVLFAGPSDLRPGLKLTDFGIARGHDLPSVRNPDEDRSGTLHYMAPEQLLGHWRDQGAWTDLYAVGCLAWRLATGHPPFHGRGGEDLVHAQLSRDPPEFRPVHPVPATFETWVLWLLQKEPTERFQSAADARSALDALGAPVPFVERDNLDDDTSTLALRPWRPGPPKIPSTWERPVKSPPPRGHVGAGLGLFPLRAAPMIGRRAERTALWDALRRVHRDGRVEAVLVHGPTGIGKSRLVEWFTTRAVEAGAATVLRATADPEHPRGVAVSRMLERHLRTEGLGRPALLDRVATALRIPADSFECDSLVEVMQPDASRTRNPELRAAVLRRFVARTCRARPVILWVDDAARDLDALAFAQDLLHHRDLMRMAALVVVTARDDVPAEWQRTQDLRHMSAGLSRVALGPLADAESQRLIEELLVLDAPLAARIAERTAGHPGFAVSLVRDLVERRVLEPSEAGFRVRPGPSPILPDDLHATWQSRVDGVLDGLPASAGVSLERANTLGREVRRDEWDAVIAPDRGAADGRPRSGSACAPSCAPVIAPDRGAADGRLHDPSVLAAWNEAQGVADALVERLLAVALIEPTADGFVFRHRLLAESLERRASEAGRLIGHHAACAKMLSDRAASGVADLESRLGRHLLASEQPEAAFSPLLQGAAQVAVQVGFRSALALLSDAEVALQSGAIAESDPRYTRFWVLRADLLCRSGDLTAGLLALQRALEYARRYDHEDLIRQALAIEVPARLFRDGPDSAEWPARELISRSRDEDDARGLIAGLRALSDVHAARRQPHEALALAQDAVDRAEALGDVPLLAASLRTLALHAIKRREYDRAREAFLASADRYEQMGQRGGCGDAWLGLGHLTRLTGDAEQAWSWYLRALDALDAVGSGNAVIARFYLAWLKWFRGDAEGARADLNLALPGIQASGWRRLSYGAQGVLAACAADLGDRDAYDRHLAMLNDLKDQPNLADEDLALPLERAGERWLRRGDRGRGNLGLALAALAWAHIGNHARAELVRNRTQ